MVIRLVDDQDYLKELMFRSKEADDALKQAEREAKAANLELMRFLEFEEQKAKTVPMVDGKRLRVVRVANARVKVDESGLAKSLGVRLFNTLTDRKLNLEKLDAAVLEKRISRDEIAAFVRTEEHPYLRFYVMEGGEDADTTGDPTDL